MCEPKCMCDCYAEDYEEETEINTDDFRVSDPITGKRGHSVLNKRHLSKYELDDWFNMF